jgi:hypothetical protein
MNEQDEEGDADSLDITTLGDQRNHERTELPIRQMSVRCFCCFCEQYNLILL